MKNTFSGRLLGRAVGVLALGATTVLFGTLAGSTRAAVSPYLAIDLGTLGGSSSYALALNQSGQVVGDSSTASGQVHAFSWTKAGGMIDLGTFGGSRTVALAVNDEGQVVGYGYTPSGASRAFSWTRAGGLVDLGQGTAEDVNECGQVVGVSTASGQNRAFSWTQGGGMVDLGTLGGTVGAGSFSAALAVNDAGEVVGVSSNAAGQSHVFLWTQAGGILDLGTLGGSSSSVSNNASSNGGRVVGTSSTLSGQTHAFSWTPTGGMVDLGTLGGSRSTPWGVNDAGQVVGNGPTSSGQNHAFSWTQAGGMVDLGTLGGTFAFAGGFFGYADPVNNAGQIVGASTISGDYPTGTLHAFSWTLAGGMIDLGTLGGTTSRAGGVNDHSQIVGSAYTASGDEHATLWQLADTSPPAAPSAPDLAPASDSGVSNSDNVTNHLSLALTGTAEAGSKVTLYRGTTIAGTATADAVNGNWTIGDTVPTGGVYSYTATATDAAGNTSPASTALVVTVDIVAPALHVPSGIATDATSPAGAIVSFSASVADALDPAPVLNLTPASGTAFPIGDATVTCTATDAAGNVATTSFFVHVRGAAEQLTNLANAVKNVGPGTSLADKIAQAQQALSSSDAATTTAILKAFGKEVAAQSGKKFTPAMASDLSAAAARISAVLG
jgi:probable HAF family extracellular repeat protein